MRILPPLPATAQMPATLSNAPASLRILAAEVIAPLEGDLYQVLAGQMTLQVRSTIPLQPGQQIQLQLPQETGQNAGQTSGKPSAPGQWQVVVSADGKAVTNPQAGLQTSAPPMPALPQPAQPLPRTAGNAMPYGTGHDGAASARPRAMTEAPLPAGDRLAAALPPTRPGPAEMTSRDIRQHLQSAMPRQQDPGRLVALLSAVQPLLTKAAESPLLAAVTRLLAVLPEAGELTTPEAIRSMLKNSGLLSESAVPDQRADPEANRGANPEQPRDLKQALLALRDAAPQNLPDAPLRHGVAAGHLQPLAAADIGNLRNSPDATPLLLQLAAEAEPVLARLETHQLQHLQQRDGQQQQWLFELPIRQGQDINIWQFHLEKDRRQQSDDLVSGDCLWSLTLSVDFPETGALMVRLGLQGNQLHAHFHATAATTLEQIRSALPTLRAALENQGISAPLLTCQRGLPHRDTLPAAPRSVLEISA